MKGLPKTGIDAFWFRFGCGVYVKLFVSYYLGKPQCQRIELLLIDFSLTVKAATLIFISGRGSAISSAKEGKSGFIYEFCKELISFLSRANVRAFHENPNRIHTELTFINP